MSKSIGSRIIEFRVAFVLMFLLAKYQLILAYPLDFFQQDSLVVHDSLTIKEVKVKAPIYIQSLQQWPGAINRLSSKDIGQGNSYQLSEQLNVLPGVYMQQGTMSTNRITIRGIGSRTPYESNRIKAYWGDMPLTDGNGVTSIEDLSLNDISDIRVLKGPSSALYGAGLGGVLLIDPWQSLNDPRKIQYKGELGSFASISNQLNLKLLENKRGQISMGLGQLNSQGFRENSKYSRYNFTLKGRQRIGRSYLYVLYNYRYLNGQIPSSLDSIDFVNNPHNAASSWKAIEGYEQSSRHLVNGGLNSSIGNNLSNSFNLFAGFNQLDELRPFNRLDESARSIGLREKISYSSARIRAELGLELMSEKKGISTFGVKEDNLDQLLNSNDVVKSYINAFGLVEFQVLHKWLIQAAFNLNKTNYMSEAEDGQLFKHQYNWVLSPRVGLNYEANALFNIFTSVGHGFSAPSLEEAQLPDLSFNPDIQPEEGINYEIGLRFQSADKSTNADLALYYMDMTNLLVTKRESEAVFYGINAGETKHKGLEFSVKHLFYNSSTKAFDMALSFFSSVNTFGEFEDEGINHKGNHLPGIPEYNLAINAHAMLKSFHVFVSYKVVGDQYLTDDNSKIYESFHKLGAKLSRDLKVQKIIAQIFIGADNILNEKYASMVLINAPSFGSNLPRYYYPGMPFNIYGGLSVNF